MSAIPRIGLLLLALSLAACGSTPRSDYYRLSSASAGGSGDAPAIGIGPIQIPEYLNRNSMVFSRGDNQLHIASFQRWAEPLSEGVKRVLGLNLSSALDTENIRPFPWPPSDAPDYGVQVWILSLDASSETTRLVAEWRLHVPGEGREVMRRISRYEEAGTETDGGALAASYSRLLGRLSEEIAAAIAADRGEGKR
ncbi:PqiC family protein [Parahaliea mediterranea]|uniref:Membrane integrity-associated transporter subunit PqiC n=1 Tax=Parahaliea mediterranea TaxID=651086 RepID=A0A939DJ39_9GAMM|nr:PqiC family protein [Parahaliea mediterranea]MBN7798457.1 membrane integrity-associated transporter subunit PqiC [Parahaliea mediterranea]